MNAPAITFSDDQAEAWDNIAAALRQSGIDLDDSLLQPPQSDAKSVMAVIGKAGSGKVLSAQLQADLAERWRTDMLELTGCEDYNALLTQLAH